jgi:hypothetical protein
VRGLICSSAHLGWARDVLYERDMGMFDGIDSISSFIDKTKVGGIPVAGSIINGAQAVYNLGAAGIDAIAGDTASEHSHLASAAIKGVEAIPYVGTAASIGETIYNATEGSKVREPDHGGDWSASETRPLNVHDQVQQWMFGPQG